MSSEFTKTNTVLPANNVSHDLQAFLLLHPFKANMVSFSEFEFTRVKFPSDDRVQHQSFLGLLSFHQSSVTGSQENRRCSKHPSRCNREKQHTRNCINCFGCYCTDFALHCLHIYHDPKYPQQVLLVPAFSPDASQPNPKQRRLTWILVSSTLQLTTSSTTTGHSMQTFMTNTASLWRSLQPFTMFNRQVQLTKILQILFRRIETVLLLYTDDNESNNSRAILFKQQRNPIDHKLEIIITAPVKSLIYGKQMLSKYFKICYHFATQNSKARNVQHILIEDDDPLRLPPKLQRAGKSDHSSSSLVAQHAVGRESIASCKGISLSLHIFDISVYPGTSF